MSDEGSDINLLMKRLQKENALLKKKYDICSRERSELEGILDQTRRLLDTVALEKLSEEEQKQLDMFRKFVPQEFLQSLKTENWVDIKLGDHVEHEMTVLFNDIRSFTLLSETMTIEENFAFINHYLNYMFPPISQNNGFVDKYIGDSIMALFNHPRDAIEAGIAMHKALQRFNAVRAQENKSRIDIGIGLHCGNLMMGVIGVENRLQGTVISHHVNLASHLESLTKLYGSALLASQDVMKGNEEEYPNRFLGKAKVATKDKAGNEITTYMNLYEILPAEADEIYNKKMESKFFLEAGILLYYEKRFAEASVQFTQALQVYPTDKVSIYYLKNCALFMVNGVPEHWDGTDYL